MEEDDDDLFGDDIALEELQGLTDLINNTTTVIPTLQNDNKPLDMTMVDTSEIFDDDIPLDELDGVLASVESSMPPELTVSLSNFHWLSNSKTNDRKRGESSQDIWLPV